MIIKKTIKKPMTNKKNEHMPTSGGVHTLWVACVVPIDAQTPLFTIVLEASCYSLPDGQKCMHDILRNDKIKRKKIEVRKIEKMDGGFKVCVKKFTFILLFL